MLLSLMKVDVTVMCSFSFTLLFDVVLCSVAPFPSHCTVLKLALRVSLELIQWFGSCPLDQPVTSSQSCVKAQCELVMSFALWGTEELSTYMFLGILHCTGVWLCHTWESSLSPLFGSINTLTPEKKAAPQDPNELDGVVTVQVVEGQQMVLSKRLQVLPKRFDLSSWLVFEFIWLPVLPLNQISAYLALQGGRCPFCIQKTSMPSSSHKINY